MQKYHLKNRPDREILEISEIKDLLLKGKFAVISTCMNNEPYIVTLSYGFDEKKNSLYFHCAPQGLKIDYVKSNPRICATIIEDGGYVKDECAHNYKTVVFWGKIHFVADLEEKRHGMQILLSHLEDNAAIIQEKLKKSEAYFPKMTVLRIDIEEIHAKVGK